MHKFFLTLILVFSLIACDIDDEIQNVESDNVVDDSSMVNIIEEEEHEHDKEKDHEHEEEHEHEDEEEHEGHAPTVLANHATEYGAIFDISNDYATQ